MCISHLPTCAVHIILLDLIVLIIFGEKSCYVIRAFEAKHVAHYTASVILMQKVNGKMASVFTCTCTEIFNICIS